MNAMSYVGCNFYCHNLFDALLELKLTGRYLQGGPKKVIPLVQCNVMYER